MIAAAGGETLSHFHHGEDDSQRDKKIQQNHDSPTRYRPRGSLLQRSPAKQLFIVTPSLAPPFGPSLRDVKNSSRLFFVTPPQAPRSVTGYGE